MTKILNFVSFAVAVILFIVSSSSSAESDIPFFENNFYRDSCPQAETIIRDTVVELFINNRSIAPALIRLVFHDCFIVGCDGSVLLNATNGVEAERDQIPNQSLKGFDVVEEIKSRLELLCPDTVSCSDILVLAARDSVFLEGESFHSYPQTALKDIPAPDDPLDNFLEKFSRRDFTVRETVSLLGAHSNGAVHCNFILQRLTNFSGTGGPDPAIKDEFVETMRARCAAADPAAFIDLKNDGAAEAGFGTHYYQGLVQNFNVLASDQKLMNSEKTASWVRAYASNQLLFTEDFSSAMIKLSDRGVLTGPGVGEIRRTCSKRL
ncbi:hypothetical protein MKW94_019737 [Papaver nudicaule]|uniref:Peroxidase n=1 Tax=Papaver nudicaule TaxID=74823 RepID=A0AA41VVK7_PAPNU|nr:hypothetical protein [Papaver nudicaule]